MQRNINRAIEQTFNIRGGDHGVSDCVRCPSISIDGYAVVSQDCNLLQDVVQKMGYSDTVLFNFVQHGRWSCINIDKIKVMLRLKQVEIASVVYNVVYGSWKDGIFHVEGHERHAPQVRIRPEDSSSINFADNYVLLPHTVYRIVTRH